MRRTVRTVVIALIMLPGAALAQQGAPPSRVAPAEASQFDFLVGQWELTVKPRMSGMAAMVHGAPKLLGTWKGWRAFDGWGVQDELRITDASGNPAALAGALRVYDAKAHAWNSTGIDAYRAAVSGSTGSWSDGKMILNGRGTDQDGKPYLTRSTFSGITATSFTYVQERSYDDGKTWGPPALVVEAKRVAAVAPR